MPMSHDYASPEPSRADIDAIAEPLVLEFGTPWCGHCRALQPLLEDALKPHPRIRHLKIEDGKGRRLGRLFGVKLWPTLVFLQSGKEISRLVRPTTRAAVTQALQGLVHDQSI